LKRAARIDDDDFALCAAVDSERHGRAHQIEQLFNFLTPAAGTGKDFAIDNF